MTRSERKKLKSERRANMQRHGALNANAFLPEAHDTRFSRRLVYIVTAALLAMFFWAASTPVNEITSGGGVIKTRTSTETVEHPDGGLVASVHVSKGERVAKGTRLLTFDTGSLDREMGKLRASQAALLAERSRISFLLEDKGVVPEFSSLDDLEPDELLFWAEQSYLDAQLDLISAKHQAITATLASLKARRDNQAQEARILKDRLQRSKRAEASGVIAKNEYERLQREGLQMARAVLELDGEIAAQTNALESNDLRRAELLAKRQREAALRRAEVEENIVSVALSIAEIETRIARAEVTATVSGTVMELAVSNPREIVAPGDLIAEIIPEGSAVEAEIEISADRIGHIEPGMEARLKVLSYDFTRFGEIVGRVASISPSSFENEVGDTVFRVVVALPDEGENSTLSGRPIRPGMTVTADILTDSKKVLTYLLKPLRVLSDRAFSEA